MPLVMVTSVSAGAVTSEAGVAAGAAAAVAAGVTSRARRRRAAALRTARAAKERLCSIVQDLQKKQKFVDARLPEADVTGHERWTKQYLWVSDTEKFIRQPERAQRLIPGIGEDKITIYTRENFAESLYKQAMSRMSTPTQTRHEIRNLNWVDT